MTSIVALVVIGVGIALLVWSVWSNLDDLRRPLSDPTKALGLALAPDNDSRAGRRCRRHRIALEHLAGHRTGPHHRRRGDARDDVGDPCDEALPGDGGGEREACTGRVTESRAFAGQHSQEGLDSDHFDL